MRAQTSAEYLAILAVILIIVVFALRIGLTLPQNKDTFEDQATYDYWRNADIGLMSWAANGTHITYKVKNNMPFAIEIEQIVINNQISFTKEFTLEPGADKIIIGDFTWDEHEDGEEYSADVSILYEHIDTMNSYIFYGQAPVQGELTSTIVS